MRTTRADDFKQCSHLLESTSLMKDVKKLSSNCSHELLYFVWMPACASVTFLVIAECLTRKGLWPVGRGARTRLWPPRQIHYVPWSVGPALVWPREHHTGSLSYSWQGWFDLVLDAALWRTLVWLMSTAEGDFSWPAKVDRPSLLHGVANC